MKKRISLEEAKYVAKLANLPLTEEQLKKFTSQVSEVIEFNMSLLEKINTVNVEPTAHATGISSKLRKDETEQGLDSTEALQNAKNKHNGFFKVKAILEPS
jgi:aspartyl-tRNA(Asn)/glutamyl-tRNA(Gln) amidotransferase subunit C